MSPASQIVCAYSALHVLSRRCYGKQRFEVLVNNRHFGSPVCQEEKIPLGLPPRVVRIPSASRLETLSPRRPCLLGGF